MVNRKNDLPELNGLSIDSMTISQDGELRVSFDLPIEQTTYRFQKELQAVRSFDVYEHPRLQELSKQLFQAVRDELETNDPDLEEVDCDDCATSSCCRKYNVLTTNYDLERLRTGLSLGKEEFYSKYVTEAVDWCDDYKYQLVCDDDDEGEEKCVFLKHDPSVGIMRCSVYEIRPQICRDFDMKTCTDFVSVDDVEVIEND